MRRKDKEITDQQIIKDILTSAIICRIGLSDNNIPYIVPTNFVYHEDFIYIHGAKEGKKLDIIKKNPHVCLEVEEDVDVITSPLPCSFSMRYKSVITEGKASIIEDKKEKMKALDLIIKKYSDIEIFDLSVEMVADVDVIKISITSMTGKKSAE